MKTLVEPRVHDDVERGLWRRAEPLSARIKGASREVSEGIKLISDHGLFSPY